MARYRPQKIRLSRVQGVSERLELIESNKAESAALDAKQDGIAFQEEGSALGGTGTVTEIDFTGAGADALKRAVRIWNGTAFWWTYISSATTATSFQAGLELEDR